MRVLHLISNYKFTGPVDPALLLAQGLRDSGECELLVGLGSPPAGEADRHARAVARARGLPVCETIDLRKHRRLLRDAFEARRLSSVLRDFGPDIVHTHLGNDLRIALRAGGRCVVHSLYDCRLNRAHGRFALRRASGLVAHSQRLFAEIERPGRPAIYVPPPLDLDRFNPDRALAAGADHRVPEGRIAIGVVARMQRHRQFDLVLRAFREAARKSPDLLLIVVGRGTRAREVAVEPARDLGLDRQVIFAGYVSGDDYVAILKRCDAFVFLVPGTDGTCRALREAMALGKAAIGSRRGMIPEILGGCGILVDESLESLASAIETVAGDPSLRERLGGEARKRAAAFDMRSVAASVFSFYRELAAS